MFRNTFRVAVLAAVAFGCGRERSAAVTHRASSDSVVQRPHATAPASARDTAAYGPADAADPPVFSVDTGAAHAATLAVPPMRIRRATTPSPMRGIYVNRASAIGPALARLVALADHTEINAFVIDVKDDHGLLLYPSTVGLAHAVGADTVQPMPVAAVHAFMDTLRAHHIFAIARVVVARDPLLIAHHPDWAVQRAVDGKPWLDATGTAWLDPHRREIWAYAADLASEAVARGFSEVVFDAVRFPDDRAAQTVRFPLANSRTRSQVIRDQLTYLRGRFSELGVPMAIVVPGAAATDTTNLGIGQQWEMLADRADIVMPEEYPSRFPSGSYGITNPAEQPAEIVRRALADALRRGAGERGVAEVVPWYQDFTLGAPAYGAAQIRAQIEAGYDSGLRSWMLWNPTSTYTEAALHEPPKPDSARARKHLPHR